MDVKLLKIKTRKELEYYVSRIGEPLSCSTEGFNIYMIDEIDKLIDKNTLCSESYGGLLGFQPYNITIGFPDKEIKEIVEKIPPKYLESKSCIQISHELDIPFMVVANYKSFLMEILWDLKYESECEYENLNIDGNLIQKICSFHCKEFKDRLISGCTYTEKCY